ncbi:MAG: TolC family protein [Candidatus Latescibacterota bacterium]
MSMKNRYLPFMMLLIVIAGCGARPDARDFPKQSFPVSEKAPQKAPVIVESAPGQPVKADEPRGVIDLRDALSATLENNPELSAARWQVRIMESGIGQSAVRKNPELDFAAEQFGGVGSRKEFDGAEITFRLSQVIELGGKRTARIRESKLAHEVAAWDYEIMRLDILTRATGAYIALVASQEKAALADETVALAENFAKMAAERVKAGKVAPIEEAKANVSLSRERINQNQRVRELAVARKQLAAFWGGKEPVFEKASGVLDSLYGIPSLEQVRDVFEKNPHLARWAAETERYSSRVALEKKRRIPDITVSGGAGRYRDDNSTAYLMGLSFPLPLFDRNQWSLKQAEQESLKAADARRSQETQVKNSFYKAYQELVSSYDNARVLTQEIIPVAQKTLGDVTEGYRQGKFSSLDVLEAQKTYFETREQGIDTLAAYHTAVAEVERLAGAPLQYLVIKR